MARKKTHPEHENHERWLVSYADFITLLFAFFVVMFASSQADKGKAQQMSESVKAALEGTKKPAQMAAALIGGGKSQEPEKPVAAPVNPLQSSLAILQSSLADEIQNGEIELRMTPRGLVVSFAQAALFPSGEDLVSSKAYAGLEKVGAAIADLPNPVRLEGHTDSKPIKTPRFNSNWDLSAGRSIALLKILTDKFSVPGSRMSVAGYADTAPLASNDTEAGRARNRRVDIVVLNEEGVKGEPSKMDPGRAPDPLPAPVYLLPPRPEAQRAFSPSEFFTTSDPAAAPLRRSSELR